MRWGGDAILVISGGRKGKSVPLRANSALDCVALRFFMISSWGLPLPFQAHQAG
jgi:hypothetical protein